MSHQSLYNEYRPQDFSALIGQEHVKTALTNSLKEGKVAHAYIFAGPRGTGKTSTARILAKALNCDNLQNGEPCNECEPCKRITQGNFMDIVEVDAASNGGVEAIRTIIEKASYTPVEGKYKVYIIDEAHMLSPGAFNALLKTLEEPPEHVVFVLATTEPHKILATIHSRCQRYDFHRVTLDDITDHLVKIAQKANIKADEDALRLIAIQSDGGVRDALSLLEQCSVMAPAVTADTVRSVLGIVGREVLRNLVLLIGKGDLSGSLAAMEELIRQGKDVKQLVVEIIEYFRALLLFKADGNFEDIYLTDTKEAFGEISPLFTEDRILASTERLHETLNELRFSVRGKILVELCIFDLCKIEGDTLKALSARVAQLEMQLSGKTVAPATVASTTPSPSNFTSRPMPKKEGPISTPATPGQSVGEKVFVAPSTQKTEEKAPEKKVTPPPQPKVAAGSVVGSSSAAEIWTKVIGALDRQHKKSTSAYCKMAKPKFASDGKMSIVVPTESTKERLESATHRAIIENTLEVVAGMPLRLVVIVDSAAEPTVLRGEEPPQPKVEPKEELPKSTKSAMDVFGGHVEEK